MTPARAIGPARLRELINAGGELALLDPREGGVFAGRTVSTTLEDNVLAHYALATGPLVTHEMSYTERGGTDRFRLEVYTEAATVWLRSPLGAAAMIAPDLTGTREWVVPEIAPEPLGAAHHRHWIAVAAGVATPDDTAAAGLSTVTVAEHLYEAARTGTTIPLSRDGTT